MKMTNMKKKVLLSSLALAMVTTSTLVSIPRVYGEGVAKPEKEVKTEAVKAFYTGGNKVKSRNASNNPIGDNEIDLNTITDLMVGDGVTSIPENRFKDLPNLTTLTFKGTETGATKKAQLITIEANAFKGTGITSVTLPPTLTTIGASAFENSKLTTLDLTPITSTLTIGADAFKGNKDLASVKLSTKLTELKSGTFASTNITTVEIAQGITTVSPFAFQGTPLSTLTVNSSNTTFEAESNVLYKKGKTNLYLYPEGIANTEFTIPNTVTTIENSAFYSSPHLTKIVIGEGLTTIGQSAFENAKKLATLDLRKAKVLTTVETKAFHESLLSSIIISDETGFLNAITEGAFKSKAPIKTVSFKKSSDSLIVGDDLTTLVKKYKALKEEAKGLWTFDAKLMKPAASVDYTNMKLTSLVPSAVYTIQEEEYTADDQGKVDLLKKWGGKKISIVRKAALDQNESEAQEVTIDNIYSLNINGEESLKKASVPITATASGKEGYQFTTWESTGVTTPSITGKTISFTMPESDVTLTAQYREITVETPVANLLFDGKNDVVVTITSTLANFDKLKVNGTELTQNSDYTVTGEDKTTITLKKKYLDALTETATFEVSFKEGGKIVFSVRLFGSAPAAIVNYKDMKLTGLEVTAKYKINGEVKTTDEAGNIKIEKAWGGKALEIVKVGTDAETDSKPQNLILKEFYLITIDGKEFSFTTAGMKVTLKAERKEGYKIKEWTATGVTLTDANKEEITFEMPANDVVLKTSYMKVITTKLADMIYDGTKEVIIRIDIPMNEFQYIEYNGQKLTRDVDYIVSSGSTIITFTKTFLDKMQGDMTGIKAVFTNNSATFTIKRMLPITPANPTKVEAKANTKQPNTGDSTNIYVLCMMLLGSIGTVLLVKKRNKQF